MSILELDLSPDTPEYFFNYDETEPFQRIRRRNRLSQLLRTNDFNPTGNILGSRSHTSRRIYCVRRILADRDSQLIIDTLKEAEYDKERISLQTDKRLYISILNPRRANKLYRQLYSTQDVGLTEIKEFNERIKACAKSASREHPKISTQLGGLAIYGAVEPAGDRRFVGIRLTGQGSGDLIRERVRLNAALSPHEPSVTKGPLFEPHIRFAIAESIEVAKGLIDNLNKSGMADLIRDRLRNANGSEHMVTFGRAVLERYPIEPPIPQSIAS